MSKASVRRLYPLYGRRFWKICFKEHRISAYLKRGNNPETYKTESRDPVERKWTPSLHISIGRHLHVHTEVQELFFHMAGPLVKPVVITCIDQLILSLGIGPLPDKE